MMIWSIALAVYLVTHVSVLTVGIIPKQSIGFTKFWTFLFASKPDKSMLKSLAKSISLCEISRVRFERERERKRERGRERERDRQTDRQIDRKLYMRAKVFTFSKAASLSPATLQKKSFL